MTRATAPFPITLDAALRDADLDDDKARILALTHLGSAYLHALGSADPVWLAHTRDPRGDAVKAALLRALQRDPVAANRGLAVVGLGQLGAPELLSSLPDDWFVPGERRPEIAYCRECAAIAWTLLALAAKPVPGDMSQSTCDTARANLRRGLASEFPELRFQCAVGLAEVDGRAAEAALAEALTREQEPGVRGALVTALGDIDPPSPATCDALAPLCDDPHAPTAFAAALALTVARDPRGGPALLRGLARAEDRGRALEALAALGPRAPEAALPAVRRLAYSLFTPGLTRVRAAYALTRLAPHEGQVLLARLANSWRAAVREAVNDARDALAQLAARESV